MTLPRVSVIMPVYNAELFLKEAIESILSQSYSSFELLLIDDGSTDQSADIIGSFFNDARIRVVKHPQNLGLVATLNEGVSLARGEFIARMDSDDISHPTRFEEQVQYLDSHPEIALCGTWFTYVGSDSPVTIQSPLTQDEIKLESLRNNPFGHPTVMFRKRAVEKFRGPYRADFFLAEDYELWCRLMSESQTANLPQVLLTYRIHKNQISARSAEQKAMTDLVRYVQFERLVGVAAPFERRFFLRLLERTPITSRVNRQAFKVWKHTVLMRARFTSFLPLTMVNRIFEEYGV